MLSLWSTEHIPSRTSFGAPSGSVKSRVHIVNGGQGHRAGSEKSQGLRFLASWGGIRGSRVCPSVSVHQLEGGPPQRPWCPALWMGRAYFPERPHHLPDTTPHSAGCLAGQAQDLFSASPELQCEPASPFRPCGP